MYQEGLTGFLTFTLPIILVVLFFLCFFRFLFRCCNRIPPPANQRCPHHHHLARRCGELVDVEAPPSPPHTHAGEMEYRYPYGAMPLAISELFTGSTMVPPLDEPFPPKYEDAIKLPAATPRTETVSSVAVPPPFYDSSSYASRGEASSERPPAYAAISVISNGHLSTHSFNVPSQTVRNSAGTSRGELTVQQGINGQILHNPSNPLAEAPTASHVRPSTSSSVTANVHKRDSIPHGAAPFFNSFGPRPATNASNSRTLSLWRVSSEQRPKTAANIPWPSLPGAVPEQADEEMDANEEEKRAKSDNQ